jgi:hypothetical protein
VTGFVDETVSGIDPRTNCVVATIRVGAQDVAVGAGSVDRRRSRVGAVAPQTAGRLVAVVVAAAAAAAARRSGSPHRPSG